MHLLSNGSKIFNLFLCLVRNSMNMWIKFVMIEVSEWVSPSVIHADGFERILYLDMASILLSVWWFDFILLDDYDSTASSSSHQTQHVLTLFTHRFRTGSFVVSFFKFKWIWLIDGWLLMRNNSNRRWGNRIDRSLFHVYASKFIINKKLHIDLVDQKNFDSFMGL